MDRANAAGSDITLDFYPYTASSGPMAEYTSPETVTREWGDRNQFATCPPFPQYQGRMVSAVADDERMSLPDLLRQVFTAPGRPQDDQHRLRHVGGRPGHQRQAPAHDDRL